MVRIVQSKVALLAHLTEQIGFIIKSCNGYDLGDFSEAKRIATAIRVLLHDTQNSKSLFYQLGLKEMGFINTAVPIKSDEAQAMLGLLQTKVTVHDDLRLTGQHHPLLNIRPDGWPMIRKRFFGDWWNQTVLTDTRGRRFSRRLLVMAVANTDGGAHVDPSLDADYAALSRGNSIGFAVGSLDGTATPIDKSELASIRQIAHEILCSLADKYPHLLPTQFPYGTHREHD